ncbi:MAG: hypothetical protein MR436_15210 [Eubacterium sp.]|nr:hypothetical protein [Eubacterium sp.]
MDYKVVVTVDAEEDLNNYIRYFMMHRIDEDVVFVDNIFHELQDYENIMI